MSSHDPLNTQENRLPSESNKPRLAENRDSRRDVDDELSLRERSLVVVAALITQGGAEQQLRSHTRWAIQHGCTRSQLEALATLLGVYAGYPRASNGLMVVREELTKLEEQ